jgi:lipopolysaccharide/colanic/teichoic acid biosynthesis glycosyltransferase
MTIDGAQQCRMSRRLQQAQTPWGRARLSAYVRLKRAAWHVVVNGTYTVKRAIDITVSVVTLIVASPLLAIVAALVRMDGGPVLFGQTRVGLNGEEFTMLKFRSMTVGAEARLGDILAMNEKPQGVTFKMRNDPRVTRIGRFLRKTSLDEVPQFINVLRGEMSLVGPRPALPREVAMYSEADRRRLLAVPGLTCLWQVGEREGRLFEIGDRNAIDFDEQVSLDVRYIESQSVWRDILLLAKTIPAVLLGKGM